MQMAYLKQLLKNCNFLCLQGELEKKVTEICYDSGKARKGSMFVCLKGQYRDGHDYISEAVCHGATVCVVQHNVVIDADVTVIRVRDTREALAILSAEFYGNPARHLRVIGITGTKGKTSTACMIYQMLRYAGCQAGMIGTMGIFFGEENTTYPNTTPESLVIQQMMRRMVDAGCGFCVMEVSSQGLKNHRVDGIVFDIGVFTNISPDHIGAGEHASFAEYLSCKSRIFARSRRSLINADDCCVVKAAKKSGRPYVTYGIQNCADYRAGQITYETYADCLGMRYTLSGACDGIVELGIPGIYNVYNSLAAIAVCRELNIPAEYQRLALRRIKIRGRMEEIRVSEDYRLLIDYAHNAVSFENLLETLRAYHPKRLVTLFGCGGNRSKLRRYQMGEVAGRLSDVTILTSDNPRYEDPEDIILDIETGLRKTTGSYIKITDRREAIAYALTNAKKGDLIVLAGKGHEQYQEIKGHFYPMDERKMIDEVICQYHY